MRVIYYLSYTIPVSLVLRFLPSVSERLQNDSDRRICLASRLSTVSLASRLSTVSLASRLSTVSLASRLSTVSLASRLSTVSLAWDMDAR